ncbi:hypothetical protein EOD39_18962 [Acipenser ruthenus]|uniref:SCAN box domain-containing protein n=1 Tax=Acipenser ruthenus TaxID=7906 RepID=A0A444UZD6_ACIRT|nr:hypothetical protein EOD39_18962 [Acipenser ruthenus]
MVDYPTLKATVLNRVGATPEGYRRKFREEVFAAEEHPRTIARRLKDYAMGWLNLYATPKARLVEAVLLAEQFLEAEPTSARLPGKVPTPASPS